MSSKQSPTKKDDKSSTGKKDEKVPSSPSKREEKAAATSSVILTRHQSTFLNTRQLRNKASSRKKISEMTKLLLRPTRSRESRQKKVQKAKKEKCIKVIPMKKLSVNVTQMVLGTKTGDEVIAKKRKRAVPPKAPDGKWSRREARAPSPAHSLDDEDLLEILTCESPVWWEEAPHPRYREEPIFSRADEIRYFQDIWKSNIKVKPVEEINSSHTITAPLKIPEVKQNDDKFMKKRSKLENLLGNIKNKLTVTPQDEIHHTFFKIDENKVNSEELEAKATDLQDRVNRVDATFAKQNETDQKMPFKRIRLEKSLSESTSSSDDMFFGFQNDDILRDLENIDIPMENKESAMECTELKETNLKNKFKVKTESNNGIKATVTNLKHNVTQNTSRIEDSSDKNTHVTDSFLSNKVFKPNKGSFNEIKIHEASTKSRTTSKLMEYKELVINSADTCLTSCNTDRKDLEKAITSNKKEVAKISKDSSKIMKCKDTTAKKEDKCLASNSEHVKNYKRSVICIKEESAESSKASELNECKGSTTSGAKCSVSGNTANKCYGNKRVISNEGKFAQISKDLTQPNNFSKDTIVNNVNKCLASNDKTIGASHEKSVISSDQGSANCNKNSKKLDISKETTSNSATKCSNADNNANKSAKLNDKINIHFDATSDEKELVNDTKAEPKEPIAVKNIETDSKSPVLQSVDQEHVIKDIEIRQSDSVKNDTDAESKIKAKDGTSSKNQSIINKDEEDKQPKSKNLNKEQLMAVYKIITDDEYRKNYMKTIKQEVENPDTANMLNTSNSLDLFFKKCKTKTYCNKKQLTKPVNVDSGIEKNQINEIIATGTNLKEDENKNIPNETSEHQIEETNEDKDINAKSIDTKENNKDGVCENCDAVDNEERSLNITSNVKTAKYCLKCSSIFETETCSYCAKISKLNNGSRKVSCLAHKLV